MKVILGDILFAYQLGVKTMYYHNTRDGASDVVDLEKHGIGVVEEAEAGNDDCVGGACKI